MTEHEGTTSFPSPPAPLPEETLFASPPPRRNPATYVAVLIGLVAMAGGAVFFARSLGTAEGGADTPVAAVHRMFDAIEDEDALGVLESLLPTERDLLTDSVQSITEELGRLGILSNGLDLGAIEGIELDFSGLTFSSEELASDINLVTLTGGTATYRVDPARAPLGDFVRELMPEDANEVVQGTEPVSSEDAFFATVKDGDKWYVSLGYSIAEAARRGAGAPLPNFGDGIAARGEPTPEAAVEQFIRSAVLLDVQRLIELTPPDEARALHDYAPLFIDAAKAGADEARKHYSAEVSVLKLSGNQRGDRALVKISEAEFAFDIPELGVSVDYDGECVTMRGGFFFGSDEPQRQCGSGFNPALPIPNLPQPEIGFVAVREDGAWYVSPTRTVLESLVRMLEALDRSHLEMFKDIFGMRAGG